MQPGSDPQARDARADAPQPLALGRRMAPSDALFWYAEQALPQFRATIAGLYVLDGVPDAGHLDATLESAIALVPRLRQRVREMPLRLGLPEWVDDAHFDRRYHLRHVAVAPPGDPRHLLDLAATLFATPFDRERPLWEATWIEGLAGGRSAYFLKMHHALVDGVGSIAILDALTQPTRDEPARRIAPPPAEPPPSALGQLAALARDRAADSLALAGWTLSGALRGASHPLETASGALRAARGIGALVADALQPAARDPEAARSGGLSRRFDVIDLPLERLRKLRAPLDATVNDVVLAALAGALGCYQREQGQPVRPWKCMVPMNLRGRGERDALGNRVGMFDVMLPLDEERPRVRLERIRAQTRAAKRDRRGAAGPAFVELAMALPEVAFRRIARAAVGRVNVACTNVPGTPQRRYLSGARVAAIYPFASVMQGTPVVMALLSYAGTLHVGIDTDPEVILAPGRLPALLEAALAELEALA